MSEATNVNAEASCVASHLHEALARNDHQHSLAGTVSGIFLLGLLTARSNGLSKENVLTLLDAIEQSYSSAFASAAIFGSVVRLAAAGKLGRAKRAKREPEPEPTLSEKELKAIEAVDKKADEIIAKALRREPRSRRRKPDGKA